MNANRPVLDVRVRDVAADGARTEWCPLPAGVGPDVIRQALEVGTMESRLVLHRRSDARLPVGWWTLGGYRCAVLGPGLGVSLRSATVLIVRYLWPLLAAVAVLVVYRHDQVALSWVALGGLLLVSVWVHELGHVVAFQLVTRGQGRSVLVAHALAMHSARPPLLRWQELVVVSAGPVAPVVVVAVSALVRPAPLLWWAAMAVAVGHAVCLAAPVGDGANLRTALGARLPQRTGIAC